MVVGVGGGVVFELGNPEGRGAQVVLEIQVERGGGSKNRAFRHGGVDFFWNNPMHNAICAKNSHWLLLSQKLICNDIEWT